MPSQEDAVAEAVTDEPEAFDAPTGAYDNLADPPPPKWASRPCSW